MNHDDNGLPPVDVVIPDDARELDADVQLYHREMRQRRRRERSRRFVSAMRRAGPATPLLVGVLFLAALGAAILTVLAPRQQQQPVHQAPLADDPRGRPGKVGAFLPALQLAIDGTPRSIRRLRPAVFALVPRLCRCEKAASEVAEQSLEYQLPLYLVASEQPAGKLKRLTATTGVGSNRIVADPEGVLSHTYSGSGLTVVLVHRDGIVSKIVRDLEPGTRLEPDLAPLRRPGEGSVLERAP